MEEEILIIGEISTDYIEKKSGENRKQSFVGALLPLIVPLFVLIHIYTKRIEFSDLDSTLKFFFWAAIIFSCVLFFLHGKFVEIENNKNGATLENAERQSIIVTNKRIYGNNNGEFSFDYSELEKIYSSKTAGNSVELVIRTRRGDLLKFQHIKNYSSIIAIASEKIQNNKIEHIVPNEAITNPVIIANENVQQSAKSQESDLFDVMIVSGIGSLEQIKIIRQITLFDLKKAKDIFLNLPYILAESQTFEEANNLKTQLECFGLKVIINKESTVLTDVEGKNTDKNQEIIPDGYWKCMGCGDIVSSDVDECKCGFKRKYL